MRIEANLLTNMWPKVVKATRYISNYTLIRKLSWKTLFKAIKKEKLRYAHMYMYGCRAYLLNHYILRKNKLDP